MDNDMAAIRSAKSYLRNTTRMSLQQLSGESILYQSERILQTLSTLPEYQSAKTISVFLSMPTGEVGTRAIVDHALGAEKQVFVPYLYRAKRPHEQKPTSVMDMVSLHSRADYESLKSDKWGIPTPDAASVEGRARCLGDRTTNEVRDHSQAGTAATLDMILLPGVAFDGAKRRLGHGMGFYDSFLLRYSELHTTLRQNPAEIGEDRMPYLVGLALQEQVLPQGQVVPTTTSDWPLDCLIVGDGSII